MRRATKKQKADEEAVKSELLCDVLEGRKLAADVLEDYKADAQGVGLNVIKYYKEKAMYLTAERDYLDTCARFYQLNPHPSTLIYVTGSGGSGKTTLARAIAQNYADVRGIHMVGAPGKSTTFDFVNQYRGQKVSIFNEAPPRAMGVEQFLDAYDPQQAAIVNSRHSDKPYFAEYAIFTASMPFEKFLYEMWKPYAKDNSDVPNPLRKRLKETGDEKGWHDAYIAFGADVGNKLSQIRRRFAIVCNILDDGSLRIRCFDAAQNPSYSLWYRPDNTEPFPVYKTLPFDINTYDDVFEWQLQMAVKYVGLAIDAYYSGNGFKHPDEYEKPF